MNTSDFAVVAPWQTLLDKPSKFDPTDHTHDLSALERSGANFGDVPMFFEGKWIPVDITKQTDFVARLDETVEIIKSDTQTSVTAIRRLVADFGQANASLTQTLKVLSDKNQALAESDEQLQVLFGRNQASVDRLASAVATANSSTANVITQLRAQLSADDIKIQALSTTSTKLSSTVRRVGNQVTASAQAITSLDSRLTDAESGITGFSTAIDTLNTEVTTINGQITSLASRSTTLESQVNTPTTGILARISTVETVKADSSSVTAVASSVTTLTARLNTGDIATAIASLQVAVGPTGTLSTRIDALSASSGIHTFTGSATPTATGVGDIWYQTGAGIVHEFRWDGSTWVSVKDSDIGINAVAIVTEQTARLLADGFLQGKYALSVISGNVVTGMEITSSTAVNGGTTSTIVFQAGVVKFQTGTGDKDAILAGGSAADVNANTTTISGGKITTNTITSAHILAGNITSTHIASNTVITTSANIGTAVVASANIASLDVSKLNAGTISVAIELSSARVTAGSLSTVAARFNSADYNKYMPTISYANTDLVAELGAPIDTTNTSTSGTFFPSANISFFGWLSGSNGLEKKRFGSADMFFKVELSGSCNMPTGRMGIDLAYRVNGGSWNNFSPHHAYGDSAFANISLQASLPITLSGTDTIDFAPKIDHSSGAAGPGIGELQISAEAYNA